MKEVILTKRPVDTSIYLEDLQANQHIGFIDSDGEKGYLVYVGDGSEDTDKGKGHLHAVSRYSNKSLKVPNMSYGLLCKNRHHTPQKALTLGKQSHTTVKVVYVFEDRKELYLWLSL